MLLLHKKSQEKYCISFVLSFLKTLSVSFESYYLVTAPLHLAAPLSKEIKRIVNPFEKFPVESL